MSTILYESTRFIQERSWSHNIEGKQEEGEGKWRFTCCRRWIQPRTGVRSAGTPVWAPTCVGEAVSCWRWQSPSAGLSNSSKIHITVAFTRLWMQPSTAHCVTHLLYCEKASNVVFLVPSPIRLTFQIHLSISMNSFPMNSSPYYPLEMVRLRKTILSRHRDASSNIVWAYNLRWTCVKVIKNVKWNPYAYSALGRSGMRVTGM